MSDEGIKYPTEHEVLSCSEENTRHLKEFAEAYFSDGSVAEEILEYLENIK
jgi:hypothetical protein